MSTIKPTIGRVVLFQPPCAEGQPLRPQPFPALIAFVHSDTCINVGYFDSNGQHGSACSVKLLAEGDLIPPRGYFAQWMPYQIGQAKKDQQQAPASESSEGRICAEPLPPHQQRVIAEHNDLSAKIVNLEAFVDTVLFNTLAEAEQTRLRSQLVPMEAYRSILAERIAAFVPDVHASGVPG